MDNGKRTKNILSVPMMIRLADWLRQHEDEIKAGRLTRDEAAERAATDLGVKITRNNLRCLVTGEDAIMRWPNHGGTKSGRTSLASIKSSDADQWLALSMVAEALRALATSMKSEPVIGSRCGLTLDNVRSLASSVSQAASDHLE